MSAQAALPIEEPTPFENFRASVAGVFAKEARWRMRGRRAFVVVTMYLALLGLLVLAVYRTIAERAAFDPFMGGGFGSGPAPVPTDVVSASVSTEIGQAVFITILVFQTLLTVVLAPALTSGAVAMEREKQTLDMLITTPVSTVGIVLGKLVSSLAFLLLLICGSLPLMAIVFTLGGIAPDDVIRAYVLLFATAFGLGSIGLFMSALLKRTQMATAISIVIVLLLTFGSLVVHTYILAAPTRFGGDEPVRRTAPEVLLWLNPFVADIDLLCSALPDTGGGPCSYIATVRGIEVDPVRPVRDSFWPRSLAALVILGVTLTLLTTQLISPSRRIRRNRPGSPPPEEPPDGEAVDWISEEPVPTEPVPTEPVPTRARLRAEMRPMMVREAGAVLLGAAFIVAGVLDCWATPNPNSTPLPSAPITAEQRTAARALVVDAMLDPTDIPAGLTPRSIGMEVANQNTLQGYLEDGWLAYATNAWLDGTADVLLLQASVYAFEDETRAAEFASATAAEAAALPGATHMPTLDGAQGYERSFTTSGGDQQRVVELISRVGRLMVSLDVSFAADHTDWQDVASDLLATAEQRAQDALTVAGD